MSRARSECTQGTRVDILCRICTWALDSSSKSAPVYWLCGMGGMGKSTIAKTVAGKLDGQRGKGILENFSGHLLLFSAEW